MTAHRDEHLELCAGLVLGALDPADRADLEAHLAGGCAVCEAELARHSNCVGVLAHSLPQLAPPAALRSRVLAAVKAAAAAESRGASASSTASDPRPAQVIELPRRQSNFAAWGWAAAAAALAIASFVTWRSAERVRTELAAARAQADSLQHQLADERAWAALGEAPHARIVPLAPTPAGTPQLAAHMTFDPDSRRGEFVSDSMVAPMGHDYELWAISKAGPVSLGLVRADSSGRVRVRIADCGDPATLGAFAISLEATGGAPTPNAPAGPVVMVGKIAG